MPTHIRVNHKFSLAGMLYSETTSLLDLQAANAQRRPRACDGTLANADVTEVPSSPVSNTPVCMSTLYRVSDPMTSK